jgi:Glycosyltransferase family 87
VTPSERRRRIVIGAIMLVLAIAAVRDLSRLGPASPWRTMDDFPDFYCAGWAVDRRMSPYTYEPLHGCEHRVNTGNTFRARLFASDAAIAVPAPQPPYDFLPWMPIAQLPFAAARVIDAIAIVGAVMLTIVALAGLGVPIELAAAALALSTGYAELNTGQLVAFALLPLVLCGLALARGRDALAGVFAILTAIEPTAGLPVVVAMLLFVPRARPVLAAGVILLAGISLVAVGPQTLLEYFTAVLPAHAGSELHFPFQYSLTYAVSYFGLAPPVAQLAGAISYIALLVVGLRLAPRTSAALRRRELLVFVPALCAVVAGPFLHQEEICFALPALCIFALETQGRARALAAFALCTLSIPWILVWGAKQLFLASVFVCVAILLRLRIDLRVALGFLCLVAAAIYALELHPPRLPVPSPNARRTYVAGDLVQTEWRDYTEQRSTRDPLWFAIKLPTWAALLAALGLVVRCSLRFPPASESNPESSRDTPRRSPA